MRCGILNIGTELLMGQIVNTNATDLSKKMNELGIGVLYHLTVGDNEARIKQSLKLLMDECDLIITTGGLGPTEDDITKACIAEVLEREMVEHKESREKIESFYNALNRSMPESNLKQALIPKGAEVLINNNGTAPGLWIENDGKIIVVLPGPPRELNAMFAESVLPRLKAMSNLVIKSVFVNTHGIGESSAEERVLPLIKGQSNPTIGTYAKPGNVQFRVTASDIDENKVDKMLNEMVGKLEDELSEYIYHIGPEDLSIEQVVAKALVDNELTISTAESCTGGLLSARLVDYPSISASYYGSFITYDNAFKKKGVKVDPELLKKHGAVSPEVCEAMVKGLVDETNTDVGISVTGIAGPGGGTDEKPVGLVYIGLYYKGQVQVFKENFFGNRMRVRNYTVQRALKYVYNAINNDIIKM